MVWPGNTYSARPGQQQADARDVHALLALRHGAADDGVVDAFQGRCPAPAPITLLQHVRQHFVRAGVAE
jgi:hypothetical protein